MTKIEATEARKAFSKTLRDAKHGERVVIMKRGKPAAALVSISDLRLLRALERRQNASDAAAVREAKAEIAEQGTIPWEQIKAELGL
jgi:prevent-host-death family protein